MGKFMSLSARTLAKEIQKKAKAKKEAISEY